MAFSGQRVMLSRNLVPVEKYDMVLEKLKQNEAEVIQCSNPAYNTKNDFHVLYSFNNERLVELQAKGCNVVGPECIRQCAKERRSLPSRKYTCCMSLEGMRILTTGFDKKKKVHIEHLVSAMCGELHSNCSMGIDIVVAKDVLAPKYKWSAFTLRKPIVTLDWLVQSFQQHRRAPHEPYRLPPFAGLKVCATGILVDRRDKIADIIAKNGGTFDADLTRECTHLIVKTTDSDKYKVAKRHWCNIKLVNEQWFWDSFTEKVCLEESDYAPQDGTITKPLQTGITDLNNGTYSRLGKDVVPDLPLPRVVTATSGTLISGHPNLDPAALECKLASSIGDVKSPTQQVDAPDSAENNLAIPGETEDYLSGCRIFLAGFEPSEMKRLAMMVLDGGGTRHMEFQSKITHVILGKPSERELKEIRQYDLWGAMHVVLPTWLEECSRQRREVVISEKHRVPHTLLVQENYGRQGTNSGRPVYQENSMVENTSGNVSKEHLDAVSDKWLGTNQAGPACRGNAGQQASDEKVSKEYHEAQSYKENDKEANIEAYEGEVSVKPSEVVVDERPFISPRKGNAQQVLSTGASESANSTRHKLSQNPAMSETGGLSGDKTANIAQDLMKNIVPDHDSKASICLPTNVPTSALSSSGMQKRVFDGYVFEFTKSCQLDLRTEVIQWVVQGGGLMHGIAGETAVQKLDFLIVPHGLRADPCDNSSVTVVTPQWIRYCLEEGSILGTTSHVLFQPLPCEVPLPGFERFRFCVSQYADRERILLYNLCHVLGAKYQEKRMTKKATHLLCMVGDGEKYEAALRWGIEVVTAEWVHACVAQNTIVDLHPYRPKRLTAAEREAGLGIATQFPTASGVENCDDFQQSGQQSRETQDQGQTSQRDKLDAKGKMANDRRPSRGRLHLGSLDFQTPSAQKTANVSLSSQMAGGNLDPWDELSASWLNQQENERKTSTRSQQKEINPSRIAFKEPASVDRGMVQSNEPADETTPVDIGELGVRESKYAAERNPLEMRKEEESGPDVAAAIEGLLAQSNKAQDNEISRSPDDRTLRSPVSTTLNRHRDAHPRPHANFKRPKLLLNRPIDFDEEELPQSATSAEDDHEKFQESQLESQVVAYDEDFSGKQLIMERVRTRSMSATPPVRSGGVVTENEKVSWKGASLSRLFKAAAANK